jgi:hypothetical protein
MDHFATRADLVRLSIVSNVALCLQLVQQPHTCNNSCNSNESLSKSPNAVVVGVPDSVLSTFFWARHSTFKKHLPSDGNPHANVNQPPFNDHPSSSDITTHSSDLSQSTGIGHTTGGTDQGSSQVGSSRAHPSTHPSQPEVVDGMHDTACTVAQPVTGVHMKSTDSSCELEHCTQQSHKVPDERGMMWTHHFNHIAASKHTPVPSYPDFGSTTSGSNIDVVSSGLEQIAAHISTLSPSSFSGVSKLSSAEPRESTVATSMATESHESAKPSHVGRASLPEQSVATEESEELSTEASVVPSVCGLASENTMHDLGVELSMEASATSLGPEAAIGNLSTERSAAELCRGDSGESMRYADACTSCHKQTGVPALTFEFRHGEGAGQLMHQLPTPRMNEPLAEQQEARDVATGSTQPAQQRGSANVPGVMLPSPFTAAGAHVVVVVGLARCTQLRGGTLCT